MPGFLFPNDPNFHMIYTDNGSIFIHRDWRERMKKVISEGKFAGPSGVIAIMGACIDGGIERAEASHASQASAFMHYIGEELKEKPLDWSDEPEEPKPRNIIVDGPRLLDL